MATSSAEPKAALVQCKDQKKVLKEKGERRVNNWQALLLSRFAGSAGAKSDKPGETKDDRAKDKRRAPPPFTSQRRLGAATALDK